MRRLAIALILALAAILLPATPAHAYCSPAVIRVWKAPGVADNWRLGTALSKWNNARVSGQPVYRRTYTRSYANVEVRATSNKWWWGWSDGRCAGGVILLNTDAPHWARPRLTLHETGHTLQLPHFSSGNRVMRPRADQMATYVTYLDRRALAARH